MAPDLDPPFSEPNTAMGGGTMGGPIDGLPQLMGGVGYAFIRRDLDPGPGPTEATIIRPEWRVSVYWDGDEETPVDYIDRPNAGLPDAEPIITDWGQLVQQAKGVTSFDTYSFTVSNVPDSSGARFADQWTPSDPPEGKLVRVYVLRDDAVWQLLFTGNIVEIPRQDELEVEIVCGSVAEALDRDLLQPITLDDFPAAPPASLERFKPVVFGFVPRVEGVLVQENLTAALASSLTSTATSIEVAEDPGFSAPGSVRIDMEEVTFAGITPGTPATLTGCVRGTAGTVPADHPVGSQVLEVGPVTWLMSVHSSAVTLPKLVDSAGNLREIPADIGVTISAGPPATVQLERAPVLSSLGVDTSRSFKFIDADTVDVQNTDTGFTEDEVAVIAGRSELYTDTNSLVLSATDSTRQFAAVRRDAAVSIPEGAVVARAYVVVEHYLPPGADENIAALTTAALATDTTLLVDSIAGFPSSGTLYLGEERVTYTGTTDIPSARFTGCTRGANFAGASTHPIGTKCVQSALEVRVRPAPGFVGLVDGEGMCRAAPTTPEQVVQDTGLVAISKGFEDAHTHVVPGSHDHDADTSHTHTTPTILEWQPSLVQGRPPKANTPFSCSGGPPAWFPVVNLSGDFGNLADRNLGTSVPLEAIPPGTASGYGFYYLRGTSADASPNDTRPVKAVECVVGTSASTGLQPGTVTFTWDFNTTLQVCQITAGKSSSSVGGPSLNIGGGTFPEDTLNATANPGGNGGVLFESFSIPRSVSTYTANPSTQYVDTFTRDISAKGLTVADFIDKSYGGDTDRNVWVAWKTPDIDVHILTFRLILDDETGSSEAGTIDPTDWPDTEEATPLKYSSLSWFDATDRITSVSDVLASRIQVNHRQSSPYLADAFVLRAFYVLELENVAVSGSTEVPKRLVADVQGLSGTKASTHITHVFTHSLLLGAGSGVVDTASLTAVHPKLTTLSAGAVYEQVNALELVQRLADQHRITPYWNEEGKLAAAYRADKGAVGGAVHTFYSRDLLPTAGGPVISHAPLRDLINDVTVRARPDSTVADGWAITTSAEDAASKTAYGITGPLTFDADFIQDEASAAVLRDHLLDYGARLAERYTFRVHIEDTDGFAPNLAQVIALDTFELASNELVVERRIVAPGNGRDGRHAFVEYTCVNREDN